MILRLFSPSRLRAADLTPLFSLLQGGPGTPPCALRALSLRDNRLGDVGARQLCEALCAGGRAGSCLLQELDIACNQLSVGSIEPICSLLGACPSLRVLDMRSNPLGAAA